MKHIVYTKYKCKICSEWWTKEQRDRANIDSIKEEIGYCKLHKYMMEQHLIEKPK